MRKVISIDLGGTNIRAAIINDKNEIVEVVKESSDTSSSEACFAQICRLIDHLMIKDKEIEAISFGVAGRVRLNGYIDELPNLHIKNFDLVSKIRNKYQIDAYALNDATAAGLAEASAGKKAKHIKRVYFITISTGFGGALFVNKKYTITSTEVGHTLLNYHGELHELEHLISGTGIVNLAKLNGLEIKSASELFDGVRNGSAKHIIVYEDWLSLLSDALEFIKKTFDVHLFTITGGVMKSKDIFWKVLKTRNRHLHLEECSFKEDAGLIGGAIFAFNNLYEK